MKILVQKYGGSSVATQDKIKSVAEVIKHRVQDGFGMCVVVSAMGKTTDQLLKQAHEISPTPSRRELDMLLSCGERASMALLAMALDAIGVPAVSLTGSQSGIITDDVHSGAKIVEVRPARVLEQLGMGRVVIVAGFQGVSWSREITTLGRGGSDTTAVALAAALNAVRCEIYSDVPGVFTADPRVVLNATMLDEIGYDDMKALALFGAKVMHAEAVQIAQQKGIAIYTGQTGTSHKGSVIQSPAAPRKTSCIAQKGPLVAFRLSTVAHLDNVLRLLVERGVFEAQCHSLEEGAAWCFVDEADAKKAEIALKQLDAKDMADTFYQVTVLFAQIGKSALWTHQGFHALTESEVRVLGMKCDFDRASYWVPGAQAETAVQILHRVFNEN